jgi:hypothetical protein
VHVASIHVVEATERWIPTGITAHRQALVEQTSTGQESQSAQEAGAQAWGTQAADQRRRVRVKAKDAACLYEALGITKERIDKKMADTRPTGRTGVGRTGA